MIKTIAELEKEASPSADDVVDTLEDYSKGFGFNGEVMVEVIRRAKLSREQLIACLRHARAGEVKHLEKSQKAHKSGKPESERAEAAQFGKIATYIDGLLAKV